MSRFWKTYRKVEREKDKLATSKVGREQSKAGLESRRSPRIALCVPVLVYGHNPRKEPFHEAAYTICVNADGGLLALTEIVQRGQVVLLVNNKTLEERRCRVVRVGQESEGKREVGFELLPPRGRFWELVYDSRQKVWQSAKPGREG